MSDKKVEKIDENSINNTNSFMDKIKKNYEELSDMLKSLDITKDNTNYSTNINKFNDDCSKFIKYIKEYINDDDFYVLYMLRNGNIIMYGKYNHGKKIDKHIIEMVSNDDLKNIYELLQSEFASEFIEGCKHTFTEEWSLNPAIGENIIIDIDSDMDSDIKWFYEESHKEQKSEESKKK